MTRLVGLMMDEERPVAGADGQYLAHLLVDGPAGIDDEALCHVG
jgi:hypothetical protein